MKNYSKEEKAAFAASAFADAPDEGILFVSPAGTVLTQRELEARADKQGCDKFVNPSYKDAEVEEKPEKKPKTK